MNNKPKQIKYDVTETGCWICTSHTPNDHRTMVGTKRNGKSKQITMFLYMYENKYGALPEHQFLNHSCQNPGCINPDHGTVSPQKEIIYKERGEVKPQYPPYTVDENGCWLTTDWKSFRNGTPYVKRKIWGKYHGQTLLRFCYQVKHGKLESGEIIGHTCKNKMCINPDHSKLYTLEEHNERYKLDVRKPIEYYVDTNGCFICCSHSLSGAGYPSVQIDGKAMQISRYVLENKLHRPIGEGLCAMHLCDNPNCINPEHIIEGTHQENMKDAGDKGRHSVGKKLTREDADSIRNEFRQFVKSKMELYNITNQMVRDIIKNKVWRKPTKKSLTTIPLFVNIGEIQTM